MLRNQGQKGRLHDADSPSTNNSSALTPTITCFLVSTRGIPWSQGARGSMCLERGIYSPDVRRMNPAGGFSAGPHKTALDDSGARPRTMTSCRGYDRKPS